MFKNSNLSVIAYANSFTLWHYSDYKIKSSEIDENFFSAIYTLCNVGDKIMMNLADCYQEIVITKITDINKVRQVFFKLLTKLNYEDANEAE